MPNETTIDGAAAASTGRPAKKPKAERTQMELIAHALHEMCQPLMALQCRLEIGKMVATPDGYEEAVKVGLAECDRLLETVDVLRKEVTRGLEAEALPGFQAIEC